MSVDAGGDGWAVTSITISQDGDGVEINADGRSSFSLIDPGAPEMEFTAGGGKGPTTRIVGNPPYTLNIRRAFVERSGTPYKLTIGGTQIDVTQEVVSTLPSVPEAEAVARDVTATSEGSDISVTAQVGIEGFLPSGETVTGTVVISANGDDAVSRNVRLSSGTRTTIEARLPDQQPGQYEICARVE